jgi:hypothetical protein
MAIDIYVINLKTRTDRLEQIYKNFSNYNLHIIDAIYDEEGWKGCFKSHLHCISIAKELKLNYIIVIEDDCEKKDKFDENLILILDWLEKNINMWNIFLGGVTKVWNYTDLFEINNDSNSNSNLNLIKIHDGKTSHFMIYNSNSYDFYLNQNIQIPIDKCWHNKLIGFVSIPFLATQSIGKSDIENKIINYESRFSGVEKNFIFMIKNNTKQ